MSLSLPQHRLFVYGTLQWPERVRDIIGRALEGVPAHLDGYRCGRVARADFPGIVPDTSARTVGQLLSGLSQDDLTRLDAYEGELYRRIRITAIVDADGSAVSAWVYAIAPWAQDRVTKEPWRLDQYLQQSPRVTYRN
ncbi:MAG TPA: gamma-glutamylcyclotransferase family protein [Dongiaceae bacterium]|nr:gamma-glutamylcyclotransferase family protein [Dongiaceae bacterium]